MADAIAKPPRPLSIAGALASSDNDVVVRAMTAADAAFDRQLFDEDRGAQFAPLGLAGPMLTMLLDQQFRAQQLGYGNEFPDAEHFIIVHAGKDIGRLTTALREQDHSRTLHVIYIVLSASARGRGIGTDVIDSLGHAARARCATQLSLSVLHGNAGARRLYERLGFRAVADDGVRIAMVKQLA
jgi:ribosomal protein S18 acetylase RimI-like enzyme